jgi:phycobilisome core-membrane linker protein
VVDALVNGEEYKDCFGEDTVPYERFITPKDLNVRRTATLTREVKQFGYDSSSFVLGSRPDASTTQVFRGSGDVTRRNLASAAKSSSADWTSLARNFRQGEDLQSSLRLIRLGEPIGGGRSTPGLGLSKTRSTSSPPPLTPMTGALSAISGADGYRLRSSLPTNLRLNRPCTESDLQSIIDATYKQVLNRVPLQGERLIEAESRLRNDDTSLNQFVEEIAMGDAFQTRLFNMAPLRAASAATMALLGRAAAPAEVSRFLTIRAQAGQPAAVKELLEKRPDEDTVPRMYGMNTRAGVNQATLQRTAALYRGNAAINPSTDDAI